MRDKINKRVTELTTELNDTIAKMNRIKQQIASLNQQGEQLAQHATFLNGKIEQCQELLNELQEV